jgi:hypothetical protein
MINQLLKLDVSSIKPDTLNPYYYALYTFLDRLKWDLRPASFSSRAKLKAWKDRHRGQKAVIVCNGPSLLKSDLSLLKGVTTFGLNKINLLFDKSNFRPTYIVAVNKHVIEQNRDFFNKTELPLFLEAKSIGEVKPRSNVCYLHTSLQNKFAKDCSMSLYRGGTVTFVAMQLAYHMGFSNVALIGCDHSFATEGPANKLVESGTRDDSHFDPNYFAGGVKWQLPNLPLSEYSYSLASETYKVAGRQLVNATVGGNLEVLSRISLEEFIAG